MKHSSSTAITIAAVALFAIAGCGDRSLGACDMAAAQELVYSQNAMVATKGQALANDSCGNAAFCHSANAKGSARMGAPAGMNFDMLPVPSGWPALVERRSDAWELVASGDMPPGKDGTKVLGDGKWLFDVTRSADAPKLPPLATDAGKSAFRNWLACGAPLVSDPHVPTWAQPSASSEDGGTAPDFSEIYTSILQPNCAVSGCHNASASGELSMVDACSAYDALLKSGGCSMPRVTPGDSNSLLLRKLESSSPGCGGPMPPTGPLSADKVASIRAWVEAGASASSCK